MIRDWIASSALAFGLATLSAQNSDFSELLEASETKIEAGLKDYQSFLQETSSEKLQLVSKINQLENELVALRAKEKMAERSTETLALDLEELEQRNSNLDTQAQYTSGVLSEYLTNFESRIHISEDQSYRESLFEIREAIDKASKGVIARLPHYFETIETGLERHEELVGGKSFDGRAITPTGGVKEGSILLLGPTAYFSAKDASESGFLEFNPGTIEPGLVPLPNSIPNTFTEFFATGSGSLAFDASQGKAYQLDQARGNLIEHLEKGGWVGYSILALGACSILIALLKTVDLRSTQVAEPEDLGELAKSAIEKNEKRGEDSLNKLKGPVPSMLKIGIEFSSTDSETIFEAMEANIIKLKPRLQRFLPFLATTAAVAPLMGLLGTVVGMIKTFTLIEVFGTGDAKSLSSGISEALITTELGLIVAIPALILHGMFTRTMRTRTSAMEQIAADFSRLLAREKDLLTKDASN